jgi:hypothetical protein
MHDDRRRTGEQLGQRRRIDRQRVDERGRSRPGELDQPDVGEVAALAVELGVERDVGRIVELLDQAVQGGGGVDPLEVGRARDRR